MNDIQQQPSGPVRKSNPSADFKATVASMAGKLLEEWVGEEQASLARGRVAAAFAQSALAARNPSDFYNCTPASVAVCIATSALVNIMVSTGQAAAAYLQPQRPAKDAQPNLEFRLSHRGLCILARRSGYELLAIPVTPADTFDLIDGQVVGLRQDPDKPARTWDDLRGVVLLVTDPVTGQTRRLWVARGLIEDRRSMSRAYTNGERYNKRNSPWHSWPVEMAMKTAIHYAIGRGWVAIDDAAAVMAIARDAAADIIDAEVPQEVASERPTELRQALGLPDHGGEELPDLHEQIAEEQAAKVAAKPAAAAQSKQQQHPDQDPPFAPADADVWS